MKLKKKQLIIITNIYIVSQPRRVGKINFIQLFMEWHLVNIESCTRNLIYSKSIPIKLLIWTLYIEKMQRKTCTTHELQIMKFKLKQNNAKFGILNYTKYIMKSH
jgi:hypothetical protein